MDAFQHSVCKPGRYQQSFDITDQPRYRIQTYISIWLQSFLHVELDICSHLQKDKFVESKLKAKAIKWMKCWKLLTLKTLKILSSYGFINFHNSQFSSGAREWYRDIKPHQNNAHIYSVNFWKWISADQSLYVFLISRNVLTNVTWWRDYIRLKSTVYLMVEHTKRTGLNFSVFRTIRRANCSQ